MSLLKYYKETRDADGESLWWPGGPDGFPFRGPQPPQTTRDEWERLKPSGKARCRLFYLAKAEDLKDYIDIRDKCANGYYIPIDRDRVWDEDSKHYRVFLEWIELGYDAPPIGAKDAVKEYVNQATGFVYPIGRLAGSPANKGW